MKKPFIIRPIDQWDPSAVYGVPPQVENALLIGTADVEGVATVVAMKITDGVTPFKDLKNLVGGDAQLTGGNNWSGDQKFGSVTIEDKQAESALAISAPNFLEFSGSGGSGKVTLGNGGVKIESSAPFEIVAGGMYFDSYGNRVYINVTDSAYGPRMAFQNGLQAYGTSSFSGIEMQGQIKFAYDDMVISPGSIGNVGSISSDSGSVTMGEGFIQGKTLQASSNEDGTEVAIKASGEVETRLSNDGLKYADDYSANFTERSLVDKAYVDAVAGGGESDPTKANLDGGNTFTGNQIFNGLVTLNSEEPGIPAEFRLGNTIITDNSSTGIVTVGLPQAGGALATTTDLEVKADNAISVTYAQLATLISTNSLKAEQDYIINDFQTVHNIPFVSPTVVNTAAVEPILVTANSTNTIHREARSLTYPQDVIIYQVANKTGSTKGFILQRHDLVQNVKMPYDFRNCKFRRWKYNPTTWSAIGFNRGNVVQYDNKIYWCFTTHATSQQPDTGLAYWKEIVQSNDQYLSALSTSTTLTMGSSIGGNVVIPVNTADFIDTVSFPNYGATSVNNVVYEAIDLLNASIVVYSSGQANAFVANSFLKPSNPSTFASMGNYIIRGNTFGYVSAVLVTGNNTGAANQNTQSFQYNTFDNLVNVLFNSAYFSYNKIDDINHSMLGKNFNYNRGSKIWFTPTPDTFRHNDFNNLGCLQLYNVGQTISGCQFMGNVGIGFGSGSGTTYVWTQTRDLVNKTFYGDFLSDAKTPDAITESITKDVIYSNLASGGDVTKENISNKAVNLTAPDDVKYPTTLAVATELATKITGTVATNLLNPTNTKFTTSQTIVNASADWEKIANKATNLTSPDNTKYPTTLTVSTALASKANTDGSNVSNPTIGSNLVNLAYLQGNYYNAPDLDTAFNTKANLSGADFTGTINVISGDNTVSITGPGVVSMFSDGQVQMSSSGLDFYRTESGFNISLGASDAQPLTADRALILPDGDGTLATQEWVIANAGGGGHADTWGPLNFTFTDSGGAPVYFLTSETMEAGTEIKYSDVADVRNALLDAGMADQTYVDTAISEIGLQQIAQVGSTFDGTLTVTGIEAHASVLNISGSTIYIDAITDGGISLGFMSYLSTGVTFSDGTSNLIINGDGSMESQVGNLLRYQDDYLSGPIDDNTLVTKAWVIANTVSDETKASLADDNTFTGDQLIEGTLDLNMGTINISLSGTGGVEGLLVTDTVTNAYGNLIGGTLEVAKDDWVGYIANGTIGVRMIDVGYFSADADKIVMGTGTGTSTKLTLNYTGVIDDDLGKGLSYLDDYSVNFTDNSLVTKKWVEDYVATLL